MSKFTVYRADVDSPRLARVVGKLPGVAVANGEVPAAPTAEATAPESEDDGGLREKIPAPGNVVDEDKTSVVKTYGLLGLGVSMVMLGIATVGIWVYRRRKGDTESETPPPTTGLEAEGPVTATPSPSTDASDTGSSDVSIVRPEEESDDEAAEAEKPRGRTEGDRTDIEWSTRDTTASSAEESDEEPDEPAPDVTASGREDEPAPDVTASAGEDEPRPTESVDAAPLLGLAFLAASGAVVEWLQSGADEA